MKYTYDAKGILSNSIEVAEKPEIPHHLQLLPTRWEKSITGRKNTEAQIKSVQCDEFHLNQQHSLHHARDLKTEIKN